MTTILFDPVKYTVIYNQITYGKRLAFPIFLNIIV